MCNCYACAGVRRDARDLCAELLQTSKSTRATSRRRSPQGLSHCRGAACRPAAPPATDALPPALRRRYRHRCYPPPRPPPPRSPRTRQGRSRRPPPSRHPPCDHKFQRREASEVEVSAGGRRFEACSRRAHLGPGFRRAALRSAPAGVGRGGTQRAAPRRSRCRPHGVHQPRACSMEAREATGWAPSNTRARHCRAALG